MLRSDLLRVNCARMTSAVVVRPMTVADLESARALWREAEGVALAVGDDVDTLTRYLARNPGLSAVAVENERLVGAVLAGHDGRRGYLYHLAVVRERQGAGIGRALAERVQHGMKEAGVERSLILVLKGNDAGRRFWERLGWEGLAHAEPMGIDL